MSVLVTGASGGIGRATARLFGAQGAKVALLARGETGLAAAAEEVRAAGGEALAVPADVADFDQVREAARRAEDAFGPIAVWVNVAFSSVFAQVTDITPEEYRRITEVTYLGVVHGTKVALDLMLPRDRGAIVQAGSALAKRGSMRAAAESSASAKRAQEALARTVRPRVHPSAARENGRAYGRLHCDQGPAAVDVTARPDLATDSDVTFAVDLELPETVNMWNAFDMVWIEYWDEGHVGRWQDTWRVNTGPNGQGAFLQVDSQLVD